MTDLEEQILVKFQRADWLHSLVSKEEKLGEGGRPGKPDTVAAKTLHRSLWFVRGM